MCKLQFILDPVSAHCQAALGSVMKGNLTCEKLPGHKCFIKRLLELPVFQSTQNCLKCCSFFSLRIFYSGQFVTWTLGMHVKCRKVSCSCPPVIYTAHTMGGMLFFSIPTLLRAVSAKRHTDLGDKHSH